MKLYTYFRSSAAYRVRIALNLKNVQYQARFVHLTRDGGQHKLPAYRAVNPQGLVPALEDSGNVFFQSLAIIEYLDARYPEPRLIPQDPVDRARVQALAQSIACDVHPLNNLRVLQYLRSELGLDEERVKQWYQHWVAEAFRGLEVSVSEWSGGEYCYRDAVSLADVCLVPQVFNARRFECDLSPYPMLTAIADRLAADDAFARAAPDAQADAE